MYYLKLQNLKNKAALLGIKVNYMTIYKAELINLKSDGLKYKDIALIVGDSEDNVGRWITREACPSNRVIEILEHLYFERQLKI